MSEVRTYSIWLCPPPSSALSTEIQSVIDSLSASTPKSQDLFLSPSTSFPPHITLGSGLKTANLQKDIIESLQNFTTTDANALQSFRDVPIKLNDLVMGDKYFKSVYVSVEKTEGLVALAARWCAVFGLRFDEDSYRPHVSLAYNGGLKEEGQSVVRTVVSESAILGQTWTGGVVRVVDTTERTERVDTWRTVYEMAL